MSKSSPIEQHSQITGEDPLAIEQKRNWASSRIGSAVATATVLLEVAPTNELIRGAAVAATIAAFHDPAITSAVAGASTLLVEGGGAIVTADLLATDRAEKFVSWVRNSSKGKKVFKDDQQKTNLAIESGIALTAGTPLAQITRHIQRPELTREENRIYGLCMALGTSAVITAAAYPAALGIDAVSPKTVGLVAAGAGVLYAAYKSVRGFFSRRSKSQEERIETGESL